MPGPQTPVIRQNKQYGDRQALDRLAQTGSGLKQDNADYIPQQRNPIGRPPGPQPAAAAPTESGVPPEHAALIEDFSRAALVAQVGAAVAQEMMAGPWLRMYAQLADGDYQTKGESVRSKTPFFE